MGCAYSSSVTGPCGRAGVRTNILESGQSETLTLTTAQLSLTSNHYALITSHCPVRNYFNYFTEIEERFQQRRGSILLLSTLDWALIDTWQEAGIPLDAALRGIDAAFDKYEQREKKGRMRRINGLAWCAQAVMQSAQELREASAGSMPATAAPPDTGFEHERVAAHLEATAAALDAATVAPDVCAATAHRLREMAGELRNTDVAKNPAAVDLESLERTLTVFEEKLF